MVGENQNVWNECHKGQCRLQFTMGKGISLFKLTCDKNNSTVLLKESQDSYKATVGKIEERVHNTYNLQNSVKIVHIHGVGWIRM